MFCQLAETCCWGRGNLYLEHSLLHFIADLTYMLKENCFLCCGQILLCELNSQSHEHLAYTERLKLHHSFLKFGPAGPAACVTCAQSAKVSWVFLVVSWNLLVKVNICKVLHNASVSVGTCSVCLRKWDDSLPTVHVRFNTTALLLGPSHLLILLWSLL